jgi:hypothetical protein
LGAESCVCQGRRQHAGGDVLLPTQISLQMQSSGELQSLGSFISNLVEYIHNASEENESGLIELGRPNTFIRNPVPNKAEWDFVQDAHPFDPE